MRIVLTVVVVATAALAAAVGLAGWRWHVDTAKFVCNALAPAEISRVIIDEDNRSMEVIVPDEFLSIAIAAMQPVVAEIFQISRFNLVFDTFPTVREALVTLSPDSAAAYGRE